MGINFLKKGIDIKYNRVMDKKVIKKLLVYNKIKQSNNNLDFIKKSDFSLNDKLKLMKMVDTTIKDSYGFILRKSSKRK